MKNIMNNFFTWLFIISLSFVLIPSCSDDDNNATGNPPVINSVSASVDSEGQPTDLSPTNIGFANNTYIIRGSGFNRLKKVYFNDVDTSFNPNFVTDNSIFVTIDINTPYANASNKLKVVTEYGTVEYDFTVAPPAPILSSYNFINAADGETITLYGDFFLDPVVTIGNTQASIISSTLTKIEAVVPSNSFHKYVTVTTISGSSTSSQAIGTAIYDDERADFVENWLGPWDGSGFTVSTAERIQGENSIETTFGAFVGFKIPMYATPVSTAGYSGIRISCKSTKENGKFKVVLNNNYGAGKEVTFTNKWTSIVIPFTDLGGAPAQINELVLQEFNGGGGDKIFIDDIGFVLNN